MSVMPGYPVPRSQWATSGEACTACRKRFSFFTAKENCPCCGRLFCSSCLSAECTLTPMGLPSAICLECFQKIQDWRRVHREQQRQEALQNAVSSAAASPSPPAAEARLTSLETQFGRLQQSGRQLREESDSIMNLLVAKDKTIAELAEQQQRLTAEKESATRVSEEARQQVRVLAAARDEATQALREVQEKLSASQETGASTAEKMDALLEANAILKTRITNLQSESAEWQRRCNVANAAVAQSHKEAEDAQTALRSASKELAEARREKEDLRTANEAFAAERRAQEAEVTRLKSVFVESERQTRLQQEKQGDDAAASRDAAAARTAEQQQRLLELTEEGKTLRATMKSLEARLKEAEQRSAQEHKARTDAESRVAALAQELTEYEKKENTWTSLQKAHEEAMHDVRTAAERASHEAAVTHQQLLKSMKDSEGSTAALLSEKQGTIDSLTRELRAAQDGLEALQSQVSAVQQSAAALRDELRQAEDAAEAKVSAAVATVAAERDAARALLAQREEEVAGLMERLSSAAATAPSPAVAVEAAGPLDRTSRWRRPTRVEPLRYTPSQLGGAERGIPAVAGLERWEFDTKAEAARANVPDALVRIGYQIALDWLLFPSTDALQRWVRMLDVVQHNYYPNPYHNKEHAADILQGVYALVLQCPGLLANMTKVEKRAVVFAAAVHDVRHPGRTEAFLKNTFDPTYFAYNGCRVLEQLHTATAFQLLGHADLDFTQDDMDDAEVLRFHELVASLIAVTYMGSHATLMQTWSRPLREGGSYDMSKASDRHTVLGMLLHTADIGAQSRGIDVAVKWLGVVDEMYEQGDEEAALGLPVGPGNSRGGDVKRGQIFFMEMFVIPLFDLVHQLFPAIEAPMRHLRTLHAHYSAATEQPQRPFPPSVAYAADAEQQRAAAAEEEQRRSALTTREAQLTAELAEKQGTIDSLTRELRAAQDGLEALQSQVSAVQQSAAALRDELRQAEDAAEAKVSAAVATVAAERDAARALLAQREEEVAGLMERLSSAAATAPSPAVAVEAAGPLDRTSRWRRPTRVEPLRYTPSQLGGAERGIPAVAGLERWEFDTKAEAARADVPDALVRIGYQIALDWLLFPSTDALQRWVRMLDVVQHNYYPNPYHNKEHAADILQGVYALVLQCPGLLANMTKVEKRAVVFAAAVHDVRHPGRTEAFLKNTFDPTYFAYNGCRVLEQLHTATAFQLLGHADLDFTQDDMDDAEVLRFHELVASLIAVTYMGSHATLMQTWSRPLREGGSYDMSKASDRHTVLGMLLHAADIGAQSRGIDVAVKWLGVVDEMYEQGDEEAALGLPVGPGNSRGGDVKRGQIFFMEMFVIPLFDLVHQLFPAIEAPMRHLRTLHAHYSTVTEQPQRPFPPPVAYAADAEQQRAAAAEEEQRRSALATREAVVARKEKAVELAVERLRQATATVAQRETQLSEREAQLTARLSEPSAKAGAAEVLDDSRRTEEELHRAAAAVVEREAAVQKKAAEVEAVTAELEQREAVTSQLSSQLATIAERVNRRRQMLRYREAQVRAREAAITAAAFGRGSEEEESGEIATTAARHNGDSKATRETSLQPSLAAGRTAELAKLKSALDKLSSAMSFM